MSTFTRVNRNVTTAPATLEELRQLYAVCMNEKMTYHYLGQRIASLRKLPKAEVIQIARDFGIVQKPPSRALAMLLIRNRIFERKESWQRTQFGTQK